MQRDLAHLWDIVEAAKLVLSYVEGTSREDYESDQRLQDAVNRRLEIIGEAARRVTDQTRSRLSDLPWKQMIGLRNILIHQYDEVNLDTVWDTIHVHLPTLIAALAPHIPPEK